MFDSSESWNVSSPHWRINKFKRRVVVDTFTIWCEWLLPCSYLDLGYDWFIGLTENAVKVAGHKIAGHETSSEAANVFNHHKRFVWFVVRMTFPVVINSCSLIASKLRSYTVKHFLLFCNNIQLNLLFWLVLLRSLKKRQSILHCNVISVNAISFCRAISCPAFVRDVVRHFQRPDLF